MPDGGLQLPGDFHHWRQRRRTFGINTQRPRECYYWKIHKQEKKSTITLAGIKFVASKIRRKLLTSRPRSNVTIATADVAAEENGRCQTVPTEEPGTGRCSWSAWREPRKTVQSSDNSGQTDRHLQTSSIPREEISRFSITSLSSQSNFCRQVAAHNT